MSKTVKMLRSVPIKKGTGICFPSRGSVLEVDDQTAESLVKGGDAEEIFAEQPAEKPTAKKPKAAKTPTKTKSLGAAPENK